MTSFTRQEGTASLGVAKDGARNKRTGPQRFWAEALLRARPAHERYTMARTRAVLTDPERSAISNVLMDAQAFNERLMRILVHHVKESARLTNEIRQAQERLTAAEMRTQRTVPQGECRRRRDRRTADSAAAA